MVNSVIVWFIIGIILTLSEFLIPGFTIFFFGLGALVTSLIILLIKPIDNYIWLQVLLFLTISIVSFITLRKKFKKTLKGELFQEKKDYINKKCQVIETVTEKKPGRILYQGTSWTAYSTGDKILKNKYGTIVGKKENDPMIFIIEKRKE